MMRRPPKFVQGFIDHDGGARFYFRRVSFKRVPLPGLPWSPTFMAAYEAAMAGQPPQMVVAPKAKQGSLAALAASYFAPTAFLTLKPMTRREYSQVVERLCKSMDKNGNALGTHRPREPARGRALHPGRRSGAAGSLGHGQDEAASEARVDV
jgi:hypothetical protein